MLGELRSNQHTGIFVAMTRETLLPSDPPLSVGRRRLYLAATEEIQRCGMGGCVEECAYQAAFAVGTETRWTGVLQRR